MGGCHSGPWRWRCRCSGRWSARTVPWLGTCGPGRSGRSRRRGAGGNRADGGVRGSAGTEADGIVNDDFRLLAVGPGRAIGVVAGVAGGGRRQLGWWPRDTDIGKPRQGRVVRCWAVAIRQARGREQGSSFIASFSVEFFSRAGVVLPGQHTAWRWKSRTFSGAVKTGNSSRVSAACAALATRPPGHPRFFPLAIPGQRGLFR